MSEFADDSVVRDWVGDSEELFFALKREYAIGSVWEFDVSSPDVELSELRRLDGTVAFALRRIQAIRQMVEVETDDSLRLLLGYVSDLYEFLRGLTSGNHVSNPLNETIIVRAKASTKALLALTTSAAS
jgi:hypothetical protein